jgi:hypothetical protein
MAGVQLRQYGVDRSDLQADAEAGVAPFCRFDVIAPLRNGERQSGEAPEDRGNSATG